MVMVRFLEQHSRKCGFYIDIIGMQKVKILLSRWRTAFKNGGAITIYSQDKQTARPIDKVFHRRKYTKCRKLMKVNFKENELLKSLRQL